MIFLFLIQHSVEINFRFAQINQTVVSGLSLKSYRGFSPFIFNQHFFNVKASLKFQELHISRCFAPFLSSTSSNPTMFYKSNFDQFLNSAVKFDSYVEPNFKGRSYIEKGENVASLTGEQTFLLCSFQRISGSGLWTKNVPVRVYSCKFFACGNTTANGGGIYASTCISLLVNDCDFISCIGVRGGAVYCEESAFNVFRNSFQFCNAILEGGAFYYKGGVNDSTIIIESNHFKTCTTESTVSNYFYIIFNNTPLHSIQMQFNKYAFNEDEDAGVYITIARMNLNSPINIYNYRNAYGIIEFNVHILSTETFTPLPPTPVFSATAMFSLSSVFSKSEPFTLSQKFTNSAGFSASSSFTPSFIFTASNIFTPSSAFSKSNLLPSRTIYIPTSIMPSPTKSRPFTSSNSFSQTEFFSTKDFTESLSLIPATRSFTPYPSMTATISRTPVITWPKLSLGLIILAGIILIAGIIANLYLIMLCCRPSEILAQQIV